MVHRTHLKSFELTPVPAAPLMFPGIGFLLTSKSYSVVTIPVFPICQNVCVRTLVVVRAFDPKEFAHPLADRYVGTSRIPDAANTSLEETGRHSVS